MAARTELLLKSPPALLKFAVEPCSSSACCSPAVTELRVRRNSYATAHGTRVAGKGGLESWRTGVARRVWPRERMEDTGGRTYLDKLRENVTMACHGVCACHASPSGQCALHRLVQVAAWSSSSPHNTTHTTPHCVSHVALTRAPNGLRPVASGEGGEPCLLPQSLQLALDAFRLSAHRLLPGSALS